MHFAARRVAGAGAASAALWFVAARPQEDRRAQEEESCRKLGLMLPTEAQRTAVARIPGFLSARECDDVRDVVRGLKCATIERSAGAFSRPPGFPTPPRAGGQHVFMGPWTTTYLHTDDQFRQRLGGLRSRLLAAAVAVDGRERWGQLDETADVNFRTAECVSFYLLSRPPRRRSQVPPVPARRRPPGRAPLRRRFVDHHGPHARGAGRRLRGRRLRHARGRRVRCRLSFGRERSSAGPSRGTRSTRATSCSSCPTSTTTCVIFLLAFLTAPLQVEPVTRGTRVVLVAELWRGPEKTCAHRCQTLGACGHSLAHVRAGRAALEAGVLG